MRYPFRLKLSLAISLVAVGMTGGSVLFVYETTKTNMVRLMGERLMDMGRTGSFMFTAQERRDIKILSARIDQTRMPLDNINQAIAKKNLAEADNYGPTLPRKTALQLQETPEFQRIVQVLRRIKNGSLNNVMFPRYFKQVPAEHENDPPSLAFVYLLVPAPGLKREPRELGFIEKLQVDLGFKDPKLGKYAMYRFLADADYDVVDWDFDGIIDEEESKLSNPIGNFYISDALRQDCFLRAFNGEVAPGDQFYEESYGSLFSAAIPIKDQNGKVLAVLGLDYQADSEANEINRLFVICVSIVGLALVISVLVALLLAVTLNRPIAALREGAERVADRDFNTKIEVKSRDEFGLLANTFNGMVDEIREYAHGLEELSNAYYRFVPREFLNHLERESIVDVKLGDQVQREMTVLFSDIRSFTTMSEGMTPRDNFNFLNGYLGNVSPIIRQHNGFIDKYIGDAVMALFPGRCEDAIDTAVAMHAQLRNYNEYRQKEGFAAIKIGVGLHSGKLMLGTVGEEKRMEGTVISDAVNLASRLEGLTKKFGAGVIISEKVKNEAKKNYQFRYLGKVRVKGKHASQKVFEVLDADSEEQLNLKIESMGKFEEGVDLFQRGYYAEARDSFTEVEATNPSDRAARAYIEQCERFVKQVS